MAQAPTKTYDPTKIVMTFGAFVISGYAEGSMIECDRNVDTFSTTVGSQGDVVRNKSANRTGHITVNLLQSSASNGAFTAMAMADEAITSAGIQPVLIKDLNGLTLWSAAEAWIKKPPAGSFDEKQKDRKWTIDCANLVFAEAGY